jgi:hypothetical protein
MKLFLLRSKVPRTSMKPGRTLKLSAPAYFVYAISHDDFLQITQRPHPYNSRENEVVRSYLLQRVQTLAEKYSIVEVADDLTSSATWVYDGHTALYVEGSNILVKVDGKNGSLPAVLFSAHLDSSATAHGKLLYLSYLFKLNAHRRYR